MKRAIVTAFFVTICFCTFSSAGPFAEFAMPLSPNNGNQTNPATDGNKIVWQDDSAGDWDIYYATIPPTTSTLATNYTNDQINPVISNGFIIYQDNSEGNWDLYLMNTNQIDNPDSAFIYTTNDETNPAIWGTSVVWEHAYSASDMDIEATNNDDPCNAIIYSVSAWIQSNQNEPAVYEKTAVYSSNKNGTYGIYSASGIGSDYKIYQNTSADCDKPAIYGNTVVWRDSRNSGDIYGADISNPKSPVIFPICSNSYAQDNPAIYESTVVWQDNRNGRWDIYGYNLLTKQEFQISYGSSDDINPAISGSTVVYQDNRSGKWRIYGSTLTGNYIALCSSFAPADINKDCKVNMLDYAAVANKWLNCNITPSSLCQ